MPTFRDLMAQDAPPTGVSQPVETPVANGTPSAPVTALGEQVGAPPPTQQETASTKEPTQPQQPPAETSAEAEPDDPAKESPALPQLRGHIKTLETKLDEQKPFVEAVTSYFATPEEMRPFLDVVEAARQADPETAAHQVGNALYQMLGPQRYAALVNDLSDQHGDYLRERLSGMSKSGAPQPLADDDFDDDDSPPANPQLAQVQAENERLRAELTRVASATTEAQEVARVREFHGQVTKPLEDALAQIATLPGYDGVPERVRAEVFAKFDANPQNKQLFEQAAEMAARGEPRHLWSKAAGDMRREVERLTAEALQYHKRIVQPDIAAAEKAKAAQVAAAAAQQTEVPAARAAAPVTPAPAASPTGEAPKKSLRAQLFDRREVRAGYDEMRQAGRF